MRDRRNVLEVLLFEHVASQKFILPGTLIMPDEKMPMELAQEFLNAFNAYQGDDKPDVMAAIKDIMQNSVDIYKVCTCLCGRFVSLVCPGLRRRLAQHGQRVVRDGCHALP